MGLGGAQTLLVQVIKHKRNHQAFVLNSKKTKSYKNTSKFILSKSKWKFSLYPILEIRNLIQKNNTDLLHCHLWRSQVCGWLIKKLFLPNIKLIFHIHSRIQRVSLGGLFLAISKKDVNQFIVVSPTTKNDLRKYVGGSVKINIIPNFISPEFFKKNSRARSFKKNQTAGQTVLGFVGRLHREKGLDYLIKTIPLLEKSFSLRIVGDGPDMKNLKNLARRLNIKNQVIFVGKVKDVIREYSKMDIVIIPSVSEPFGLVWAEAQALGLPVIASRVGGMKDFLKDKKTGLLFEPKNTQGLKDRILQLTQNPVLEKEIIFNSKKFVKEFMINNYFKKLSLVYKKI